MNTKDVSFYEPHCAAQSLQNAWTRLASTYGCIMIGLSRERLSIKPHGFAGWIITLLGLDLDHEIPLANIRRIEEKGRWFGYGKVELQFVAIGKEQKTILLYLKKYREFIDILKTVTS